MKVVAKDIEMIAYFKKEGITPLRFRIEEDSSFQVIKIEKIVRRNLEKFCGNKMIVFTCTGIVNNYEKIFEIKYDVDKCRWILFKI